jgi:ElaB/YqjD/DUF883 family membrane-anchored ribosome-binding protein
MHAMNPSSRVNGTNRDVRRSLSNTRDIAQEATRPGAWHFISDILRRPAMRNGALKSSTDDLRSDLKAIARDAEALLDATADATGDSIQEIRGRAEKTLKLARKRLNESDWPDRAREFAKNTDKFVRGNSWGAVGSAAGVAVLVGIAVGFILSRDD